MNPWTPLLQPTVPEWTGETRCVAMLDRKPPKPIKIVPQVRTPWKPWTLIRPGSVTERHMKAAGFEWKRPC